MASFAATLTDPDMRGAIARNAWEEKRHTEVLVKLVQAYGISLSPEPRYHPPRNPQWGYLVTAYSVAGSAHDTQQDTNFTIKSAKVVSEEKISASDLMRVRLAENERRFAGYAHHLLRPTTMPGLVRFALRFMGSKHQ